MLQGAGEAFSGARRAMSAACPPCWTPPQPTPGLRPDPQQAPGEPPATGLPLASLPSAEHTMSPKCSLTAGKEYTGASPDPPNMENQGPCAPGCSGNGGSLVRPSSEALPQVNVPLGPWGICLGQGLTMA